MVLTCLLADALFVGGFLGGIVSEPMLSVRPSSPSSCISAHILLAQRMVFQFDMSLCVFPYDPLRR
jgi:hypothetical protein